ncbi:hypothetical protein Syun_022890 [Stephania yunnanensis]|uniref:Ribosomal protein L34Ae n=1 Tax=Stephania yunnanensis TaxID=152371 RepID=A0AAP0F8J5_9MAGN
MQCSKDALIAFFFNLPSSTHLLFLLFYFSSIFLSKFFTYISRKTSSFFQSINEAVFLQGHNEDGEAEEEEDNLDFFMVDRSSDVQSRDDFVAEIICGGKSVSFRHVRNERDETVGGHGSVVEDDPIFEDPYELFVMEDQSHSSHGSESGNQIIEDVTEERAHEADDNNSNHSLTMSSAHETVEEEEDGKEMETTRIDDDQEDDSISTEEDHAILTDQEETDYEVVDHKNPKKEYFLHKDPIIQTNISLDGKFVILETKKLQAHDQKRQMMDGDAEEIYGDSYTEGSTSKSSSEWRNSLTCRDSGTDDPFSSSSRRSCPTWESYSMFRKYDEEMIFFDRISAQKLNETESLRVVEVSPRSISQRIVHKLATTTKNKRTSDQLRRNPYQELERAYVAQVCLAWEALSWNYKAFKQQRASRRRNEDDEGASFCPARIAQQFQQFQVLLQRFIENEPFEHGRRPEIYARIRRSAPKLLQVPEFRDSDDYGDDAMISTAKFLGILEDAIRTFMNFLKADKEKLHSQIYKAIFKRNRSSVDPNTLHLVKRTNRKKKKRVEDLCRAQKCLRKKKLKEEEEMEILMSLIDLKLVSRVLRMSEMSQQQLEWCEEKMRKVKVSEGKVQRDSSPPLSFPAH